MEGGRDRRGRRGEFEDAFARGRTGQRERNVTPCARTSEE
jgi:hypothetical protein